MPLEMNDKEDGVCAEMTFSLILVPNFRDSEEISLPAVRDIQEIEAVRMHPRASVMVCLGSHSRSFAHRRIRGGESNLSSFLEDTGRGRMTNMERH